MPDEFDPSGGDIAVRATWTVQGQPASAESCAAAGMVDGEGGIGLVQLRIWEEYAGGTDYTEDGWIVPCSAGSLTTQPVLVPGTYRVGVYGITEQVDGGSFDTSEVTAAAIETVEAASGMVDVALDLVPED